VRAQNDEIQAQIDALADAQQKQAQLDVLRAQLTSLLSTDVSWARMLQEISMTIPGDVWLTSFQGQVTVQGGGAVGDATDSPGPLSAISGTVNFSATGLDYPSVAAWIQRMSTMPSFTQLWVPQASVSSFGTRDVVNFSSTVQVTDAARSDRLDDVTEGDES
jgi:Tfp pilus assembly protein PilN